MTKSTRLGVVLALCSSVLTACGDNGSATAAPPGVITFSSAPAGGAVRAAVDPESGRPQLRLDMTDEEQQALWQVFMKCLKDNGVPMVNRNGLLQYGATQKTPTFLKAAKACAGSEPLFPPETDPGKNPYYEEDRAANRRCQEAAGMKWANGMQPEVTDPRLRQVQRDCTIKNMNGRRG
jgi:hypothetical protein